MAQQLDPWTIFKRVLDKDPNMLTPEDWKCISWRFDKVDLSDASIWETTRKERFPNMSTAQALAELVVTRKMPHGVWKAFLGSGFVPPHSGPYDCGIVQQLLLKWIATAAPYFAEKKKDPDFEMSEEEKQAKKLADEEERRQKMASDETLQYYTSMIKALRSSNVALGEPLFWGFEVDPELHGLTAPRRCRSVATVLRKHPRDLYRSLRNIVKHAGFKVLFVKTL